MANNPAIFLDRDGTILEDQGFIKSPLSIKFYPYTFNALKRLQDHFLLFIITQQAGVSKGLVSENDVKYVNEYISETLKAIHITIYDSFYCIHNGEVNCECKMPNPYFVNHAAKLYNIDLSKSYIIGNHPSVIMCGKNAGITPVYLLNGQGEKHQNELEKDVLVFKDFFYASKFILSTLNNTRNGGFI